MVKIPVNLLAKTAENDQVLSLVLVKGIDPNPMKNRATDCCLALATDCTATMVKKYLY